MQHSVLYRNVVDYLVKQGAIKISLFGSRANGTYTDKSDLDLLVQFEHTPSLLKLTKYERELGEKIGIKIDLLTEKAISPLIWEGVNKEAVVLY